jgi:hypothetical protein
VSHPFQTASDVRKQAQVDGCRIGSCQRHKACMYIPCRSGVTTPSEGEQLSLDIVVNREKSLDPSGNRLQLVVLPPTMSGPRHGGARMQRHAVLRINGITHENFTEGSEHIKWATGAHYDRFLEREIARYEKVLFCKCVRSEQKTCLLEDKS